MVKRLTNPLSNRPPPLGNLLAAASRTLAAELDAGIAAAGFADLRAAHAPIFQVIDPAGSRMTELAARTGMTKQAMGELVRHLEKHGYVALTPDEADRRARLVHLTDSGWAVVDAGLGVVGKFDELLDRALGSDNVTQLRNTLLAIIGGTGSSHIGDHRESTDVMITGGS
ncbi:MarR family winged helix-turn-helix transcriptional regulator [Antrihabitans cavernicola]|uniref:MarR family transcriptional regulator n=1 Tax=Antrihabitans cavernicola TaxID=2495913 RepID=A0A5A7SBZ8_9NOCA|nr:MarR family transcriptional regulator [Spelaeibacter cavernicola]KAA0021761.1 MarR family transcriptional regulator [Spelaeibacter cavernicola]